MKLEKTIASADEMEQLGARLAPTVQRCRLVGFSGELGAGKTTLIRGILLALGHQGAVKSPTFTLVESYELGGGMIHHFDFYRVKAAEELEFIGLRDYFGENTVCLVEWPEHGAGILPETDIDVIIRLSNQSRTVQIVTHTEAGVAALGGFS